MILLTGLSACSKQEQHPLIGKWILSGSTEASLTISEKKGTTIFNIAGILRKDSHGKCHLQDHTITLYYEQPQIISSGVDSINISNNTNGDTEIEFFKENQPIVTLNNGESISVLDSTQFNYTISDSALFLSNLTEQLSFQKYIVPQNQISFSSILRGLGGMLVLLLTAWLFSTNRKRVNWSLVGKGLILQLLIAIAVLKIPFVERIFDSISKGFVVIIGFTNEGVNFLFGQFGIGEVQAPLLTFAITILPTIIFFSALVSLFYYYGILQKIIYVFAWIMKKFMPLSGAESLAAAGNVFLGQTESPLLVKPYLGKMTKSEIMCLMTGGMATIAGGVLAAYVGFLGGDDPVQQAFFAKHLLIASIISAPAAIIAAKILVPETETVNEDLKVDKTKIGTNALEAISNGTTDGLKLAINVGAMLLVFISLMALGNYGLEALGSVTGLNPWIAANTPYSALSFEFILGYIGRPFVWLIGVNWADSLYVGELLGTKTVVNEFVGYMRLGEMKADGLLSEKATIMSTYILCGFANFASIGIQIGGIGALVPNRKGLLSKLGFRALIGGTIACMLTAAIVGMLY